MGVIAVVLLLVQLGWLSIHPASFYSWGYIPICGAVFVLLCSYFFSSSK